MYLLFHNFLRLFHISCLLWAPVSKLRHIPLIHPKKIQIYKSRWACQGTVTYYNYTMKEKLAFNICFVFKGPVRFIGRSGSDCEMRPRLPSECRSPSGDLLRPDSLMVLHLCSPSQLHPSGRPQTLQTVMATCSPPWCTAALHCTQWSFCRISLQTPRGCELDPDTVVLALNAARSRHWQPFRQKHPFKAQPGNGTQRTPGNNFLLIRSGCL